MDDDGGKTAAGAKTEWPEDTRKSKPFFPITPYLDEDAIKALHGYKYSAEDRQYLYVYFMNPVAKRVASIVPPFIA